MKGKLYITLFVQAIFVLITSCESVINLDLETSSPQIIIQGNIYNTPGPYSVRITKSVNFDDLSSYPPVTDARVEISDNLGNSEILAETEPGIYLTSSITGTPGNKYTLTVTAEGKTYTACSTMPSPVPVTNIYFDVSTFSSDIITIVSFRDPPDTDNFYRSIQLINNEPQSEFVVFSDFTIEGRSASYSLIPSDGERKLNPGDEVTILLECIDKDVYEYFRTAGSENGQSASPANPKSNLSNGALGYFNACSVSRISSMVPEKDNE
ncbi:MAG TPA: DUF4249 domain-containing protein [Bacteroidales bacterium]|nr:DUF4249 domain-containing protein [Bacteroidales bacterium]HPT22329.1 DUF4249 domain-containing protein [Bacteroidales bacterium]